MKILWFDTETSGLDPKRHGIISLSCIVEIDGRTVDQMTWEMSLPIGKFAEPSALAINGYTVEQIKGFQSSREAKQSFCLFLDKFVAKFDKNDKFTPGGYNVQFDLDFLDQLFKDCGDDYLFSYLTRFPIDPFRMVPFLEWKGVLSNLPNRKLKTICDAFGVTLESAHESFADIEATRQLAEVFKGLLK